MFPPIWFQVLQLLVTLIYSCSFDRHALDLLEKMLTLDPSQVCYIHIVVKFAKKMLPLYSFVFFFVLFVICTYHLDQFFMPQHITHVLTFFKKKFRGYQQKMHLMRNISGLIRYHVILKGTIRWIFVLQRHIAPFDYLFLGLTFDGLLIQLAQVRGVT
jgi:hypothetical protein